MVSEWLTIKTLGSTATGGPKLIKLNNCYKNEAVQTLIKDRLKQKYEKASAVEVMDGSGAKQGVKN